MKETQLPQVVIGTVGVRAGAKLADSLPDEIRRAFEMLETDKDGGVEMRSSFLELASAVHIKRHQGSDDRLLSIIDSQINAVIHHVWTCCVLMLRLEKELARGSDDHSYWMQSSSVDIESFFVTMRSALDHVATLVVTASGCHGQAPDGSFNGLVGWLEKNSGRVDRFGKRLADLILGARWFGGLRDDRDAMVHQGARPIVFGTPENGLLFQVLGLGSLSKRVIALACETRQNGLVEFRQFGARLFAALLALVEGIAEAMLNERPRQHPTYLRGPGLDTFRRWLLLYGELSAAS